MGRELHGDSLRYIVGIIELDTQILIVETLTSKYLYFLSHHHTRREGNIVAGTIQHITTIHDAGTMLIHVVWSTHHEDWRSLVWSRTLITHIDGEAGRLAVWHVRHDALLSPNAQLVNLHSLLVMDRTRLIKLRLALIFPWGNRSTAIGHEDKVTIHLLIVASISHPV